MVAHVGIMLDRETFFHSSLTYDGAISRIDDKEYINSILEESFLSIARDPRNHD